MRVKVDKELLPMKAHYFLFNAGTAPVVPFMPTLARQLGFSTVVVGTMYTVLPIIGMLAKPFFGFIADRYQRHRQLFLISEIITAIAFFLIMFIPPIPQQPPGVQLHCHAGAADIRYCSPLEDCVEKQLQSHFANQTLGCQLHCQATPDMWNIVCEDWLKNNSSECAANKNKDELLLTTYINMNHIIKLDENEENCLYFKIPHDQAQMNGKNLTMNCPATKPYFNASCILDCQNEMLRNSLAESPVISSSDAMRLYQFWLFFGMLIVSWIGMAVVVSIGDAICFSILGERHHLYGKQRLCGSIGWGIFSIIAGVLVDKMSGDSLTKDYTIVFWMTAVIIGFDVLASTKLKHAQTHLSPSIVKDIGQMFRSVRCIIFFMWCVFIGLGTAMIWNFLFWFLETLGGCQNSMKTLQGFAMGIQCFGGELPFFFLSGWILKKIGHVNAMSLVLFGFAVRFMLYSMLVDPWYVLPIELLNGVTFGLFYSTMASYASIVAPPGTEATMQGLVGAIFEGIGVSMGSLIGGILIEKIAFPATFRAFGISAFIAFLVHVCVQLFLQRRRGGANGGSPNGKQHENVTEIAPPPSEFVMETSSSQTKLTNAKGGGADAEFTDVELS